MEKNLEEIIHNNMLDYSKHIIKNRALPSVYDGLKPAQRKILITMNKEGQEFTKSQNIDGKVMEIHPHGSTYSVSVGMVREDNNLSPLIDGKGSFGQHTSRDLQQSAPRYTDIKISEFAKEFFEDLKYNVVEYEESYDNKEMIPKLLPVKFPMILHGNQSGIAVGMNCNIPSYNLVELINSLIGYMRYDDALILYPDFPTGGIIEQNFEKMEYIHNTGKGNFKLRGRLEIDKNTITIYEIPFNTTREAIIESIEQAVKEEKIKGIKDVKDLTGLNGMVIEVSCFRSFNTRKIARQLYEYTPLETTFSVNINVLVEDDTPKVLSIPEIFEYWLGFRRVCITKRLEHEKIETENEIKKLNAIFTISCDIEKCVRTIINSIDKEELISSLMSEFKLSEEQAKHIASLKMSDFNIFGVKEQTKDFEKISLKLNEINNALKDYKQIDDIIIKELEELKLKYGKERKTEIEVFEQSKEDKEKEEIFYIYINSSGYIKKSKEFVKIEDKKCRQYMLKNSDYILVFTTKIIRKIKVSNIKITNPLDVGVYAGMFLGKNDGEFLFCVGLPFDAKYILHIYKNNKIAKIDAEIYHSNRKIFQYSPPSPIGEIITLNDDTDELEIEVENGVVGSTIFLDTRKYPIQKSLTTQGVLSERQIYRY